MPKFEKKLERTYCKFFLLPFTCESQSGQEKSDIFSHCDKNFAHNIKGKYTKIPLLNAFKQQIHSAHPVY